ncbi:MAG: amidohydrolase [Proteobacteria bacterium]|nr:MAG: amidohydrolase [Pseudomonadota bacterium]
MNDLAITLIQTDLHWHNPESNRAHFEQCIQDISTVTDVIILPEMFTTGFTMAATDHAETEPGETLQWMQQQAKQVKAAITGSLIVKAQGQFYNRLYWVEANGDYKHYDKKHLFSYAGEDQHFTAGSKRLIVEYKGWRICPLICYDLRFPVWSRNDVDYDVLIYVANWPTPRQDAWQSLLKARAIENMSYVVGVNRIGTDGNDHTYAGGSVIYDITGQALIEAKNQKFNKTITLVYNRLKQQRHRFGFLKDRDQFTLK